LTAIGHSIVLEIADNGCGFIQDLEGQNFDPFSAGLGLKGMRDRVEFSGGEFDFQTSPGQGTWIRCHWDRQPEIGDLD
jgi:signal transduction histidine kinase